MARRLEAAPGAGRDVGLDVPGAQEFFALSFVMTGLHAVHMIVGIAVLAVLAHGRSRDRAWARAGQLEVAALYWHFVDVGPLIRLVAVVGLGVWCILVALSGVDDETRSLTPADVQRPQQLLPPQPASQPLPSIIDAPQS